MIIPWIMLIIIVIIGGKCIYDFIQTNNISQLLRMREGHFSIEIFIAMVVVYITIMIGYGMIYFILSLEGIVLVEHGELRQVSIIGSLIHSVYFSGVTLLTIGYGDIIPIGIGRLIAVSQALIGYILPAAFVLKVVQIGSRSRDK
ncbi:MULTISPECIES: potassium channel family protein [unclassified Oceanobacillus]|uniref:potassium channel family protein n=1 Tax=unclassified Oceanobacillus TaxID=2630292 RepID=UPI001BE5048E|nr:MULTISPECIES: potassium channel family protein [unclassified Oceanobacillus]MBT2601390.1 two pore domain potassium channel family protein [Oceanobacillus sp. ISL-74]MBT2653445.1 two pore domain potassium channel family protein [Oceanobacillus sp. ISL-73]